MKAIEFWNPSTKEWLEEHLAARWDPFLETSLHALWEKKEDWILSCHPRIAFLLILREYLLQPPHMGEKRLRRLLPTLAQNGTSEEVLAGLSLLGILSLENRGQTPETEALCRQLEKEQAGGWGQDTVLSHFLFAQEALIKGDEEKSFSFYQVLLERENRLGVPTRWIFGRIYEKMGLFIARKKEHPLEIGWRIACDTWCRSFGTSVIADRLRNFSDHPIYFWENPSMGMRKKRYLPYMDKETEIIQGIVEAVSSGTKEAWEKANFLAGSYGDPFWITQAKNRSAKVRVQEPDHVEQREPNYRFTFFESFQGYDAQGNPLFPKRYGRKKVKQLLALLLLQPHYRMVKEVLLDQLFGLDESSPRDNYLYVLIHRLRELFSKEAKTSREWITIQEGLVSLREEWISSVDVIDYRKLASVGHQLWPDDKEAACALYEQAIRIYRSQIAQEFEYEDWMLQLRSQLQGQQEKMLKRLYEFAKKQGETDKGMDYLESLLELDEWNLSVVRLLIEELRENGEKRRIKELCRRYIKKLDREGEEIPDWLESYLKMGDHEEPKPSGRKGHMG